MSEEVKLKATNAGDARREARQLYPQGGRLTGYVNGVLVYISGVRPRGDKHGVATTARFRSATLRLTCRRGAAMATSVRNRAPKATLFLFTPNS